MKEKIKLKKVSLKTLLKRGEGITLIALVVTIVVLLILAAVSITAVFGDNGLLEQARLATLETRGATVQEERERWELNKTLVKETGNGTEKGLEQLLDELEANKLITKEERQTIEETGEVTIGSRTINFSDEEDSGETKAIEELREGQWVKYKSILCRVLYDKDYKKDYGIQLISSNTVGEQITIDGNTIYEPNAYLDFIEGKASSYKDDKVSSMIRLVFSNPINGDFPEQIDVSSDEYIERESLSYADDYEQMEHLGILSIDNSRYCTCVTCYTSKESSGEGFIEVDSNGDLAVSEYICASGVSDIPSSPAICNTNLRICIKLNTDNVRIKSGNGSDKQPYILEAIQK